MLLRVRQDVMCYCVCSKKNGMTQSYYTLKFTVMFPHSLDRVYLAHCYPFTYTGERVYACMHGLGVLWCVLRVEREQMVKLPGADSCDCVRKFANGARASHEPENVRRMVLNVCTITI